MPSPESGGSLNMWYSFNAQRTHFVSIDTETDYDGAPTTPDTRFAGGRGRRGAGPTLLQRWRELCHSGAGSSFSNSTVSWV